MSRESLNHVVSGVLFDFMLYLTTRDERLTLSKTDDASPAAYAIQEFLAARNVANSKPMPQWEARCDPARPKNITHETEEEEEH